MTDTRDDVIAGRFVSLFTSMPSWVNRRVENIEFMNDESITRRISVDFTLPSWADFGAGDEQPRIPVPIAFLRKTALESLSVRSASGEALPILTAPQNGDLAVRSLVLIARTKLGEAGHENPAVAAEMLSDDLTDVVFGKGTDGLTAHSKLASRIAGHRLFGTQLASLGDDSDFLDVVLQFATSFVLAVPFNDAPTGRTIVKFQYAEHLRDSEDERGWFERLKDRMGWTPSTYRFDLPGVVAAGSFHFELTVPEGVSICEGAMESADNRYEATRFILTRRGRPTLHMTDSDEPREHRTASVNLRASRDGWLRACVVASIAITVLMAGSGFRIQALFDASSGQANGSRVSSVDAAAVLLTLVAVAGAFVVRLDEHALTSRILSWLRGTALIAVAAPFAGAWVLAFGPTKGSVSKIWWALTALTCLCSLALVGAYAGPRLLSPDENDVL